MFSSAAALLDGLFEHPAKVFSCCTTRTGIGGLVSTLVFEPSAFAPSFDNPTNILKFMLHVSFLYPQNHFGQALHAAGVLFSGVIYDTLTLTRIDRLQDNLLLLIYLLLLGVLIVLTGRLGIEPAPEQGQLAGFLPFVHWMLRVRPYYPMAAQFLLGGLFSAYAIFYSCSATLTSTAIRGGPRNSDSVLSGSLA